MAPNADIRIRILGGIRAALEVDTVERAVDRLSDETDELARAAIRCTLALKWLRREMNRVHAATFRLRLGFMKLSFSMTITSVVAWSLASIVLPALALSLWNTTVAASTLAVAFIGGMVAMGAAAGLMAIGVIGRFKQMSGVIGSAANDLQNAGYAVRGAFRDATAAGSDALMRGLARGLERLAPLLRSLEGSFTAIGTAFGSMFEDLFGELATMGPQIRKMFRAMVPTIASAGEMLGALLGYLIQVGTIGAPLVADAFDWLARKMRGWTKTFTGGDIDRAKAKLKSFADGVMLFIRAFTKPLKPIFGDAMEDVGKSWLEIAPKLGHILGVIVAGFMEFGRDVLPVVKDALSGLASLLGENGDRVKTVLYAIVGLSLALKAITGLIAIVKGAMIAWSVVSFLLAGGLGAAVVAALPLIGMVGTIAAIAAAFYYAYENVKLFRDAVNEVGAQLGLGPTAPKKPSTLQKGKQAGLRSALETLPGVGPLFGALKGHAGGGTIIRGGWTKVGERGEEIVRLPKASTIFPAAESRSIAANERPDDAAPAESPVRSLTANWTLVLPDMRVLATGVKDFDLNQKALEG